MTTFSQSKVGKNFDGGFLLLDSSLDKILDGDHALKFTIFADDWQVTNIRSQHFLHAKLNGILGKCRDKLATRSGDLLDQGIFRRTAQQRNFGNVVTFRNDSA